MRRRSSFLLLVAALVAVASSAGTPAQDPLTVGPNIYRLVLENERVRVMEARFQPGEKIGPHAHPDHVVVVTSAGKLAVTTGDGKTQEFDAKVGDTFFIAAETHSAQNIGTTEFVCVVTELKGKYKAKDQASPNPATTDVQQGKVDG
jgi:quercetin dioxygenase-like cupin family protein